MLANLLLPQVEQPVPCDETTKRKLLDSTKELEGEIETLQKLSHPNIVAYYGCERTETHINIFLEWVPGGSIRKLLDGFGVPLLLSDHALPFCPGHALERVPHQLCPKLR
jgi:serine/threonine protein kinase